MWLLCPSTEKKDKILSAHNQIDAGNFLSNVLRLTLANGDIIRPFVYDIKREQMYAGGGGGQLYDPVSTWIKFEECTLNLGPATSVEDNNLGEDNNTDTNKENSMDDSQDSDQGAN